MGTIFNTDFREFIQALNDNYVEYILVGGYAVILHGYRRVTGDLDIWVNRTKENYSKLLKAFSQFGLSVFDMNEENFLNWNSADVFSFGRPPVSIDILTNLKGVEFNDAFGKALQFDEGGLKVRFIHLNNLIEAKRASGRHKDLDDIEKLSPGVDR
jgi:predicted nucleotidyltransferase